MHPLQAGDPAPDFELLDQSSHPMRLRDLRGHLVLLFFYPRASTPGCTRQACSVRDAQAELAQQGVTVIGISPDKPAAQQRFDAKYNLGFPLLADTDRLVAQAYGAFGTKKLYGKVTTGIIRSVFLIDARGRIVGAWPGVSPEQTVPLARAAL